MATIKTCLLFVWAKIGESMKPTAHLHDTAMFRVAIYAPVLTAAAFATLGYWNSQLEPNWTFQGFNNFISTFRLPIGLAGLAIPLGALVASHHRSIQSASQIVEQNQQNIFSNYLEHRKYFLSFIEEHEPFEHLKVSAPHLYQRLFPESADGSLVPANDSIDELLTSIRKTASMSAKAVENELSAKNFKIINKELAFYLGHSTRLLEKFINVPEFNIKSVFKDPLTLLSQTLRQNFDGIKGLIDCANFHKTYRKEDDLSNLKLETEFCIENINAMLKYYNLWRMLKAELSGTNASNPSLPVNRRLENIKLNMEANHMENEHLKVVFHYHLTEEEKNKALEHGPEAWKTLLEEAKN